MVLAGCGGTEIVSAWPEKTENQFYKLEGTEPIEYMSKQVETEKKILIFYTYSEDFGPSYPDFNVVNSFDVRANTSKVSISMDDVNGCGYVANGVQVIHYDHTPGAHDNDASYYNVDITDIVHEGANEISATCTNKTGKYDLIESFVFAKLVLQEDASEE